MTEGATSGVYLQALPPELTFDLARRAEEQGFDSVWFSEITFGDAFVPAAAAAVRTERVRLATGIVGLWSRSPVTTAMTAATLHALSGERFVLGVGLQSHTYVSDWHGRSYERPLRAVREYLTILRRILDGEVVTYEGEIFRVRGFQLQMQPPVKRVPIYLAAIGPKAIQLAGELADGLLGYVYSLPYFEQVVVPNLEIGAERAGRSLAGFDVACGFPAILTEDMSGIEQIRGQVVMFATALASAPAYQQSIALAGFEPQMRAIQERVAAGDLAGALGLVPVEMADAITIAGTPEHARERIAAYRAAGLNTFVLNPAPPGGYFPLYEGHFPEGSQLPEVDFDAYLEVVRRAVDTMGSA